MSHRLLILALAALGGLFLGPPSSAAEAEIRIGMIAVQSGEWSNIGTSAVKAVRLAHEGLPEALRRRVRIIFEDDRLQPAQSAAAFQKLLAKDHINGLIAWSSGTAKAVAPLAEAARLPTMAIASDPSVAAGKRFIFNVWVMPEVQSDLLVREAQRRGYRTLARVVTTHEGALACRDAFDRAAGGRFEIVLDQDLPPGERDFRGYLARLAARRGVDAVLAVLNSGQLGLFAKQLRERGLAQPLFGFETFEDPAEVSVAQGAMTSAWFATGADPANEYQDSYRARFGEASMITASNSFDAFMLLVSGIDGGRSPEEAAEYLERLRGYRGASGVFSASGDHRFTLPAVLKVVTETGFATLDVK